MTGSSIRIRELFTLWYSLKWSTGLGIVMFLVSLGDVVFTFLNVEKYGINGEVNPVARFMVGAGQPLTLLWAILNILSTFIIYVPLISLWLMLSPGHREGKASTLISAVLATRITVVLYGFLIYSYPAIEVTAALIVVGVVLTFSIRFTMRHGDRTSLTAIGSALHDFFNSMKSAVASFFSSIAEHTLIALRARKQRQVRDGLLSNSIGNVEDGKLRSSSGQPTGKRRYKRILILIVCLVSVPIVIFTVLQILMDLSGITGMTRAIIVSPRGRTQGAIVIIGFIFAIVGCFVLVYLIMTLIEELNRGRPPRLAVSKTLSENSYQHSEKKRDYEL